MNGARVRASVHFARSMGAAPAKSELDATYRRLVSEWLKGVQERHKLDTHDKLAAVLNRDRTTATRYLNGRTRPDLTALQLLTSIINEPLPQNIADAFYASEPGASPVASVTLPAPKRETTTIRLVANAAGDERERERPQSRRRSSITLVEPAYLPVRMPIISAVAAGQLLDPETQIPPGEYQTIEISGLPPGDYFATRVAGDSMNRLSPDGSLIVVNRAERDPYKGKRYIFGRRGETTYKRYETGPLRLVPESTNPSNEPIFPRSEEDWTVIGRVRITLLDDL